MDLTPPDFCGVRRTSFACSMSDVELQVALLADAILRYLEAAKPAPKAEPPIQILPSTTTSLLPPKLFVNYRHAHDSESSLLEQVEAALKEFETQIYSSPTIDFGPGGPVSSQSSKATAESISEMGEFLELMVKLMKEMITSKLTLRAYCNGTSFREWGRQEGRGE